MSTASGIVAYGDDSEEFEVIDARTGDPLYHFNMGQPAHASPMSYAVNGRQYFAIAAGNDFEVALKITSDKLVRGSPLQLSYDAKVLEPVAVRAGEFFAEGSFTYRVNPSGSITVGAFGKGDVPDDAEFVVVTFKPIRAGATAELKLSSLVLQGAAGALVHEPLAAFRTSIAQ